MQTSKIQSPAAEQLVEQPSSPPTRIFNHANIQVRNSAIHRFGVFANELILPGEIIEECPLLLLTENPKPLREYVFEWDDNKTALALGSGSIYNHSDTPNASFTLGRDQILRIYASKPIYCNDEILINYGKDWFSSRKNAARIAAKQEKRSHLLRVTFLLILLFFIYSFVPTFAKFRAPPFPVLTNVLQKWNLGHWETPSTAQRIQTAPPPEYTTEHSETNSYPQSQ